MTHQRQPSKTSCGPTCAAILAGVSVGDMLARLPATRVTERRKKFMTHRTNVGEMCRLLKPFGVALGRRMPGLPTTEALLRVAHRLGSNWHFAVYSAGTVLDPADDGAVDAEDYYAEIDIRRISYYEVERKEA